MAYYKQNFVSAQPIFAKIQLEMGSYFETGMINSLLFPIWTKHCLDKLGKGSFPLREGVLYIENSEARLPPDFIKIREARACTQEGGLTYKLPTAFYKSVTYKVDNRTGEVDRCDITKDDCDLCERRINVIYKTENEVELPPYTLHHLLKPGNISCLSKCSSDCRNFYSDSQDTFDINGNKFVVNFASGTVYITYYSSELDEDGTEMVPDEVKTKDYIEQYIKYKLYEMLWNQVTDETYNQITQKYQAYKQMSDEAFVAAESQSKKKTKEQLHEDAIRELHRHDKYIIK
jgi:hypothetical protein